MITSSTSPPKFYQILEKYYAFIFIIILISGCGDFNLYSDSTIETAPITNVELSDNEVLNLGNGFRVLSKIKIEYALPLGQGKFVELEKTEYDSIVVYKIKYEKYALEDFPIDTVDGFCYMENLSVDITYSSYEDFYFNSIETLTLKFWKNNDEFIEKEIPVLGDLNLY